MALIGAIGIEIGPRRVVLGLLRHVVGHLVLLLGMSCHEDGPIWIFLTFIIGKTGVSVKLGKDLQLPILFFVCIYMGFQQEKLFTENPIIF